MAVGAQAVRLLPFSPEALAEAAAAHPGLVVVDYTHPDAVHHNAEARSEAALRLPGAGARRLHRCGRRRRAQVYCRLGVPFVMGTTGGDRERLASAGRSAAGRRACTAREERQPPAAPS